MENGGSGGSGGRVTLRFNSATAVSRGKPRRSPPSSPSEPSFNSATAVSRGKRPNTKRGWEGAAELQFGHGCEPWKTAVMPSTCRQSARPLQFGHGCEPWKTPLSTASSPTAGQRFNSATAVSRGKPTCRQSDRPNIASLQFGHGCEPWKTWCKPKLETRQ